MEFRLASLAFVAVLAAYLFLGRTGVTERGSGDPRDAPYNLLARGLLAGHLSLAKDVPPGLAALADPYDPNANRTFREDPRYFLHDMSYYRGRLYLYFGVAPALLVFIPWHLLTGGWLPHWAAATALCAAGLLVTLSLVSSVRRRSFPEAPAWLLAAAALALGLASFAPLLLARADVYEVPIAFSYCMVAVALRCLWAALSAPGRAGRWIAGASAAFGVAFAARPTVLPDALILLAPFALPEVRRQARAWAAAVLPLGASGGAVALYNAARFGSPFDFGVRYQLASVYVAKLQAFSPHYLWVNLRMYLLLAVECTPYFPYAHEGPQPPVPPHHGGVEHMAGALLNAPLLWLAVVLPFLLRARGAVGRPLGLFCASVGWAALASLVTLSFFFGCCSRYQFEFVPELALLAVLGILCLEALPAAKPRALARWCWIPALLLSCAFPVLYGIDRCVFDRNHSGFSRLEEGDFAGAERDFAVARRLSPANPFTRLGAGFTLVIERRLPQAEASFETLIRDTPDYAMAHFFLGNVLAEEGRKDQAIEQYRIASQLDPGNETIRLSLDAVRASRR
jgi:tetratricopeptide (TPR) repeat protein